MKLHLKDIIQMLSVQDYLEYEKILDTILNEVSNGSPVVILGTETVLKSEIDVDRFNRKMMQVHGIYGLV